MRRYITNGEVIELMRVANEEQSRFLRRAAEMGAIIVHDSVTFPGTLEEQQQKVRELHTSLNLPLPKEFA